MVGIRAGRRIRMEEDLSDRQVRIERATATLHELTCIVADAVLSIARADGLHTPHGYHAALERRVRRLVLAAATACRSSDMFQTDRCLALLADVEPGDPVLQIGDTMTLRASFFPNGTRDCLPRDAACAHRRRRRVL